MMSVVSRLSTGGIRVIRPQGIRHCSESRLKASTVVNLQWGRVSDGPKIHGRSLSSSLSERFPQASNISCSSLVLYNSLTESHELVGEGSHLEEGKGLIWYTCGPTVYDDAHLGHARTYVWMDILRRLLEEEQRDVLFVMNVTDVDDKILKRAREVKVAPRTLATRYEARFWEDMERLGVTRPHVVARVTDHVEDTIIPYIQRLVETSQAYRIPESGVYFDVQAFEARTGVHSSLARPHRYGKLAPPAAAGGFNVSPWQDESAATSLPEKRDGRDFVLWKCRAQDDADEDASLLWDSPWGQGRPGWHIECSAMIEAVRSMFEETHVLALHGGGIDLKFPHHTNEIAQAEAFSGKDEEWIPHWVHTGHLHIAGRKMSKSLKNFITVRQWLEEQQQISSSEKELATMLPPSPGDDFRLWCLLSGSYRSATTYSDQQLMTARTIREKMVRFLWEGEDWINRRGDCPPSRWSLIDHQLYRASRDCALSCSQALRGREGNVGFDVDGGSFVRQLTALVDTASTYQQERQGDDECPVEPLRFAVQTIRTQLDRVGMSPKTVHAGATGDEVSSDKDASQMLGGTAALVDVVADFRDRIRSLAIAHKDNGDGMEQNVNDILHACDELRDRILPQMGLELMDVKVGSIDEEDDESSLGGQRRWRFCVPRSSPGDMEKDREKASPKSQTAPEMLVPVEKLFQVGQYEGMFVEFDEEGLPTLAKDGSPVSKRLRKKLAKKREKYLRQLEEKVAVGGGT